GKDRIARIKATVGAVFQVVPMRARAGASIGTTQNRQKCDLRCVDMFAGSLVGNYQTKLVIARVVGSVECLDADGIMLPANRNGFFKFVMFRNNGFYFRFVVGFFLRAGHKTKTQSSNKKKYFFHYG